MKNLFTTLLLAILLASCSLTSNTIIKPNDSFVLGNNEHGSFKVKLKNVSKNNIEVYHAPIAGGKHSSQKVKPNESATVKVDRNTALIINNTSKDTASVDLKVTGDIGLSMGYSK
ncbi:hypothetical protein [Flavobacterium sp.]|uniref:hypothetical protein n=1 Tax=Flavobacterium sp. TaxID=239 RepID=UPI00260A7888|nr:hypothetical protein [Flavobacterium sp.]